MPFHSDFYRCISVGTLWMLGSDFKVSLNATQDDNIKSRVRRWAKFNTRRNSQRTDIDINCSEGELMDLHFSCFHVGQPHHQGCYAAPDAYVITTATSADRLVMSVHKNPIR